MDKNDIINYVMHTPHNTNKAVLSDMLNQLTEGGGGGSSDFSSATVTFINAAPDTVYDIYVLALHNDDNLAVQDLPVTPEEPITLIIPLYKGSTKLPPEPTIKNITEIPTLTGEISLDSESGFIVITGDGTIIAKGTPIGD